MVWYARVRPGENYQVVFKGTYKREAAKIVLCKKVFTVAGGRTAAKNLANLLRHLARKHGFYEAADFPAKKIMSELGLRIVEISVKKKFLRTRSRCRWACEFAWNWPKQIVI